MEKEKKRIIKWIKEHKKELLIAGGSVISIIVAVLIVKNGDELEEVVEKLFENISCNKTKIIVEPNKIANSESLIESITNPKISCDMIENTQKIPIDVDSHIRNLANGFHASPEKIATAAEYGYTLAPGQTWVEAYSKRDLVA